MAPGSASPPMPRRSRTAGLETCSLPHTPAFLLFTSCYCWVTYFYYDGKSHEISSSSGVSVTSVVYEGHHLFECRNVKLEHRVVVFQLIPNRVDGVIKLKVNVMVFRPALQKPQHSQTTAFECCDFRQVKHYNSDIFLCR